MKYHTIEIDEEVWGFLQKRTKPFVDSPNTVLRRELFEVPYKIPAALEQILGVIYLVKHRGFSRNDATNKIAKELEIRPQSVRDKYCRQLKKTASKIEDLLSQTNCSEFKSILIKKFPNFSNDLDDFFRKLK